VLQPADRSGSARDRHPDYRCAEDLVAPAYASVFLVESDFAQQNGVEWAFARSVRTVFARGGMAALGRAGADQYLSAFFNPHDAAA